MTTWIESNFILIRLTCNNQEFTISIIIFMWSSMIKSKLFYIRPALLDIVNIPFKRSSLGSNCLNIFQWIYSFYVMDIAMYCFTSHLTMTKNSFEPRGRVNNTSTWYNVHYLTLWHDTWDNITTNYIFWQLYIHYIKVYNSVQETRNEIYLYQSCILSDRPWSCIFTKDILL